MESPEHPIVVALWEIVIKAIYNWICRLIGRLPSVHGPIQSLTNHQLETLLHTKYGATTFYIVGTRRAFDRTIAKLLLTTVRRRHTREGQLSDQHVRVGV